jgi:hypothetical protein
MIHGGTTLLCPNKESLVTPFLNMSRTTPRLTALFCTLAFVAGCSSQTRNAPTGPSALESTSPAGSAGSGSPSAKPVSTGATTVSFSGFDSSTLIVNINTITTSSLGEPYIDQGKVQLEILVDSLGHPVPCGTVGGTYVRFDQAAQGGANPVSGLTSQPIDLDNLEVSTGGAVRNVHCGDKICIRAHYVTGGGQTHVDTHFSAPTPYDIVCTTACTSSQGYWKTHYQGSWPASVLSGGLTLGTVPYTAAQLESILNTPPAGGQGLLILAHQLIAAKLNIANGADGGAVASTIATADALISGLVVPPVGSGSLAPSAVSGLTTTLDNYNNGLIGPGHCPEND